MKIGIVGHGADKFTPQTEQIARQNIIKILNYGPDSVCSGRSPVGGIDIWAEELCNQLNIHFQPFPAEINKWDGSYLNKIGYKQRNIQIAEYSDVVICIVVSAYPIGYTKRKFSYCYHCSKHKNKPANHVKSGGCWTAWRCKQQLWVVI